MGNLINGNINQLGKMQKISTEVTIIPPDIKERLVSYLKSKNDIGEIIDADCQILIDGWRKID
jgi:hypothetical protein